MNISKIGYGRGSTHDFESSNFREYVYLEAQLEPWEGTEESLSLLRQIVCSKVGIREDVANLEERREDLLTELKHLDGRIAEAQKKWKEIEVFMAKIGVNLEYDPIPF